MQDKTIQLEELTSSIIDCPHSSPIYLDEGKLVIRNYNIKNGRLNLSKPYFTDEQTFDSRNKRIVPKSGDLIITREAPMGEVCIIPENVECCLGQRMVLLRPDEKKCDPKYLLYSLTSSYLQKQIGRSKNSGSIVSNLRLSLLKKLQIPIVGLKEQKKIAHVLYTLDAKIEVNNKINAELEAMAKLVYDYWFVQFDFPNEEGKPYKSSGGKMVFSEVLKREVPEGWYTKDINSSTELIIDHRGKTPKKLGSDWTDDENGILALSAKVVKGGKLINLQKANRVDRELYEKWMSEKLKEGDVLMTSEAPAGEFYFMLGKTEYCLSQRLFAMRADSSLLFPSYLYFEMSRGHGYSQVLGKLSGSTVFGISQKSLGLSMF